LDLVGPIAALQQYEPHVSAVLELLNAEVDLEFLMAAGLPSQFSRGQTVCQAIVSGFSPDAFAWKSIELAALKLAEPTVAADNWFDSNEID
jgi:hypothetical protein